MSIRSGKDYIDGLRKYPKDVWISGRKVSDIPGDVAFRRPVAAMATIYDCQVDPDLRDKMVYRPDDSGDVAGLSFLIPRSRAELEQRREAMRIWAHATFGLMGRSPDYLNTLLAAMADALDYFAEGKAEYAENVLNYYRLCRDKDLFLTHAIVNPQVDRSKSSSQQADEYAHLRVVEESEDGLIVRGAKMLATHGPTADEILVYPLPFSLRPGEEKYALAFGIPTASRGLRFICREPYDAGDQSQWDHPLGSRFEEPDAIAVFNDVLIPWDRVFLYGDVKLGNAFFPRTRLQCHTGHQTAVRGLAKCRFITALAISQTRAVKTDSFLHVQEQLGECLGYPELIEGAILLSEQKAEVTPRGTLRPALEPLQAVRYHLPRFYERMVQVTQVLGAGSIISSPTQADLLSAVGPDIERYYRGADVDASAKILFEQACMGCNGHAVRPTPIAVRALLCRRSRSVGCINIFGGHA